MESLNKVPFHEVDFLLTTHRFNIAFSYVSKRGLPFIREFILRLVHLTPMQPSQIGAYFSLSKRELKEALGELFTKEEITYLSDGSISLTNLAKGYFTKVGDAPQVAVVQQTESTFAFEIAGFNCVGSKRTHDKWNAGIQLPIKSEHQGLSARYVAKHFQQQFYKLLDKGHMRHILDPEKKTPPSIYKMDSVRKVGQEPIRISNEFCFDEFGRFLEYEDLDAFDNDEPVIDSIVKAVSERGKSNNLNSVARAMEAFSDNVTGEFISDSGISIKDLMIEVARRWNDDADIQPFLGPIYSASNKERMQELIASVKKELSKEHLDEIQDLIWLAPSDSFWGRSKGFLSIKNLLLDGAKTTGKKAKAIYKPKIYLPISDKNDKPGLREWKNLFDTPEDCHAYVEGFFDGSTEVLVLKDKFAVVTYHLSMPSVSPIPIPLGFISKKKEIIENIGQVVTGYLSSTVGYDDPVDLGDLSGL